MKRKTSFGAGLLIILSLILSACASQPTTVVAPTQPAAAQSTAMPTAQANQPSTGKEVTVKIGFTSSQTGSLNVESSRQTNGFNMWMKQVNDAGGVKLADGTVVKFTSQSYDDQSTKDRVQELYTRLATDDNVDFMISPYSSGLTDAAAVIAEQYGKIMITTGAASDSTYQKGYTHVYQLYTPASHYLTGAVDLLKAADPSAKKIAIVYSNDQFSTDVSNALNDYAKKQGYDVVLFEGYDPNTTDFAPFINKINAAAPDAIMGGGHIQDGETFAKQLNDKNVKTKFLALLVAPPEPTFSDIGNAALGVVGPSQWEPLAAYTQASAQKAGLEWYGITGADFVKEYQAKYGEQPAYHAAGGYAAGMLLQRAIEQAGSLDPKAIQAALDKTDILTFFGHIKFDTSAANHGLQIGHSMVYIQWQKDSNGNLVKQVVWPEEAKTADLVYPIP